MNGLNQKKHLFGVLFLGLVALVFLATRPKTVVKKEVQAVQSQNSEKSKTVENQPHRLSAENSQRLEDLKKQLTAAQNKNEILGQIAQVFLNESVFDSAGVYFETIANTDGSLKNWSNAGDAYFQAFNIALTQQKVEKNAEKARFCYQKVLEMAPQNLHVKTNYAMTFVKSESPMKAITMLREVLDQQPDYIPAMMSLGGLSMESGQYEKAVQRFENVLKIDPNNVNAKLGIAYSSIELGKTSVAKDILTQVLKSDIDPIMKDEITKTLNSLK